MDDRKPPRDLEQPDLEPDFWNPADAAGSLARLFERVQKSAQETITWYDRARSRAEPRAKRIRRFIVPLIALGGLAPILAAAGVADMVRSHLHLNLGQIGYVFLALAGALAGFDRHFGITSSYTRYMTARLALRRELAKFQMEWTSLVAVSAGLAQAPLEKASA